MKTLGALAFLLAASARAHGQPGRADLRYRLISISGGTLTAGGKPLKAGARLAFGAPVRLSGGSATIEVGASGRLLIKGPASFNPQKNEELSFKAGRILLSLPGLKGVFRVVTPSIVAAVRGTDFYLETRGSQEAYLCVCSGAVDVTDPLQEEGRLVASVKGAHHDAHTFKKSQTSFLQTAAPMLGHTDAELEALKP